MSGSTRPDEETDLLAGEYVLGVLDAVASAQVRLRAATEPDLARAITAWERRLAPIADLVLPIPPPAELWARIDASLAAPPKVAPLRQGGGTLWSRPGFWRATTAAAAALAAVFAGIAFTPRQPVLMMPDMAAALIQAGGPSTTWLVQAMPDGTLRVRALGDVAVPSGRDFELWALAEGASTPVSLGVLPPEGARIGRKPDIRPRTQILISLEPKGGSPTGLPTGPVMYSGALQSL